MTGEVGRLGTGTGTGMRGRGLVSEAESTSARACSPGALPPSGPAPHLPAPCAQTWLWWTQLGRDVAGPRVLVLCLQRAPCSAWCLPVGRCGHPGGDECSGLIATCLGMTTPGQPHSLWLCRVLVPHVAEHARGLCTGLGGQPYLRAGRQGVSASWGQAAASRSLQGKGASGPGAPAHCSLTLWQRSGSIRERLSVFLCCRGRDFATQRIRGPYVQLRVCVMLTVAYTCISLVVSDAEHTPVCPLAVCVSSRRSVCPGPLPVYLIGLFVFMVLSFISSL